MTPEQKELYEERAAIMEFCGNMPREEAERKAYEDVMKNTERKKEKQEND